MLVSGHAEGNHGSEGSPHWRDANAGTRDACTARACVKYPLPRGPHLFRATVLVI